LKNILRNKRISAVNPKGLTHDWEDYREHVSSVCFTETPLNNIQYLFDIEGRDVELKPFGLVFSKEYMQERGANPVFYVNTYIESEIKKAICGILNSPENIENGRIVAPFIEVYGKMRSGRTRDFYWEREWRVRGDFSFEYENVVLGLCEEGKIDQFCKEFPAIKFISPYMSMEEIIERLAKTR